MAKIGTRSLVIEASHGIVVSWSHAPRHRGGVVVFILVMLYYVTFLTQCLFPVFDQVIDMFDADGNSQQIIRSC